MIPIFIKATREDNSSVLFVFYKYTGKTTPNKNLYFWIIYGHNYCGIWI